MSVAPGRSAMNPDTQGLVLHFEAEGWRLIESGECDAHLERSLLRWGLLLWLLFVLIPFVGWVVPLVVLGRKCQLWVKHRIRGGHRIVDHLHIQVDKDGTTAERMSVRSY